MVDQAYVIVVVEEKGHGNMSIITLAMVLKHIYHVENATVPEYALYAMAEANYNDVYSANLTTRVRESLIPNPRNIFYLVLN